MSESIECKLSKEGVSAVKYYYKNCPILGNIYTVCLLLSSDKKILARGITICSLNDSHNKKFARDKSKSRAIIALFKKEDSMAIKTDIYSDRREFTEVMKSFKIKQESQKTEILNLIEKYKFEYDIIKMEKFEYIKTYIPYLTPIEITLLSFNVKSSYKPKPTEEEIKMFKVE